MADRAFDQLDANNDGVLDRNEFKVIFENQGMESKEAMHQNAASVTRKLLMNVRAENEELHRERDNAVDQLRQKESECRSLMEDLRQERERAQLLEREVIQVKRQAVGGETNPEAGVAEGALHSTRSLPTTRSGAPPSETTLQSHPNEIEELRNRLIATEAELRKEREDAQVLEDELSETNLELTNVHRELKSVQRQVAALSAQEILAREGEANALAALQAGGATMPTIHANHAACWVRQCMLQWQANAGRATETARLLMEQEKMMSESSQLVRTRIQQFAANRIAGAADHLVRDAIIGCWVHWRSVTHINKTARWHLFLKDDAISVMSARHTEWRRFVCVLVVLVRSKTLESAMLNWKCIVLDIKTKRAIDAASSESLARVLRHAVQKSGVETVRQVLLRWINSCDYSKSERDDRRG